jgi:hypothetical protein
MLGAYGGYTYFLDLGIRGYYASSSPVGGASWNRAMYGLLLGDYNNNINQASMYYNQNAGSRPGGWVAGTRPDGTAWFQ